MAATQAATHDAVYDWSAAAYTLLERIRGTLDGVDGYEGLVAEIDVLLGTDTAAEPGRDDALLAAALELLRLFCEHNGEPAQAALVNDALELCDRAAHGLPDAALADAKARAGRWEQVGWG